MVVFTLAELGKAIGRKVRKNDLVDPELGCELHGCTFFSGNEYPDVIWLQLPSDNVIIAHEITHVIDGPGIGHDADFAERQFRLLRG